MAKSNQRLHLFRVNFINVAVLAGLTTLTACAAPFDSKPSTAANSPLVPASPPGPVIATVTFDCIIELDGSPSHCYVVRSTADQQLVDKTLAWLNGPNKPRYKPAIVNGAPRREEHRWVVSFAPPGNPPTSHRENSNAAGVSCTVLAEP
jgi:hypothetical protein